METRTVIRDRDRGGDGLGARARVSCINFGGDSVVSMLDWILRALGGILAVYTFFPENFCLGQRSIVLQSTSICQTNNHRLSTYSKAK